LRFSNAAGYHFGQGILHGFKLAFFQTLLFPALLGCRDECAFIMQGTFAHQCPVLGLRIGAEGFEPVQCWLHRVGMSLGS